MHDAVYFDFRGRHMSDTNAGPPLQLARAIDIEVQFEGPSQGKGGCQVDVDG